MKAEDSDYGAFLIFSPERGYLGVHPEFSPETNEISPTGRYFIYAVDPVRGSCSFYIEQADDFSWQADYLPPFILQDMIDTIGAEIEKRS